MTCGWRTHWAPSRFLLQALQEMTCWEFPQAPCQAVLAPHLSRELSINTCLLSPTATDLQLCPADTSRMKLLTSLFFCSLLLGVCNGGWSFIREAFEVI
ncbi:uncharacterized protein LOC127668680 isoform X3 [Apodemus sylvaticus]|uniref:uncharacterized protein LOC127668680 isoform X3 n=1 Tax=Apodemus sylvaticus TaxID=10129 RepID=UPI002241EE39|nr:uncharacterized protein LOC127668680 isoform X3 [Apodemus sylvaticus]